MTHIEQLKRNIFDLERQLNDSRVRLREVLDENHSLKEEIKRLREDPAQKVEVDFTLCAQDKAHK